MKINYSNPVPLNEIKRFKVSEDNYRHLFTIPIDIRLMKVENIFRYFKYIAGEFTQNEEQLSPLICTWYILFKYFRCRVAEESDVEFLELYRDQDKRITNDNISWVLYPLDDSTDIVSHLKEVHMDMIPDDLQLDIINMLNKVWDKYFSSNDYLVRNQVLLFSIIDYDIHVFTLGDVASYRYLESKKNILHVPKHANMKDGRYYIDY